MWWKAYLSSALIVVIDQVSKFVAVVGLSEAALPILPFFTFRLAFNTGAAFSLLEDQSTFLLIVGLVFVAYFSWEIWKLRSNEGTSIFYIAAVSLILAGASGNLVDRLFRGHVVDFVHLHYANFSFPIFNVADMAITFGAICWIYVILKDMRNPDVS